jgi:hypothetical protein
MTGLTGGPVPNSKALPLSAAATIPDGFGHGDIVESRKWTADGRGSPKYAKIAPKKKAE